MQTEIIDADDPAACVAAIIEPNQERADLFTLRLRRADGEELPFCCPLDQVIRLVCNARPPHLYIRNVDPATRATLLRAFTDVEDSAPLGPTVH